MTDIEYSENYLDSFLNNYYKNNLNRIKISIGGSAFPKDSSRAKELKSLDLDGFQLHVKPKNDNLCFVFTSRKTKSKFWRVLKLVKLIVVSVFAFSFLGFKDVRKEYVSWAKHQWLQVTKGTEIHIFTHTMHSMGRCQLFRSIRVDRDLPNTIKEAIDEKGSFINKVNDSDEDWNKTICLIDAIFSVVRAMKLEDKYDRLIQLPWRKCDLNFQSGPTRELLSNGEKYPFIYQKC